MEKNRLNIIPDISEEAIFKNYLEDVRYQDRKTLEERLFELAAAYKIIMERKKSENKFATDFITDVSHELRTPLAIIKEAVSVVLDETAGGLNREQKKYLEVALQNAEYLKRLIEELLNMASLDLKRTPIKRSLFDVVQIARYVTDSLSVLAKDKGVSIIGRLPDAKIEIWGDPHKLREVLTNIIDNAVKYNRPNGKVEVGLEDLKNRVKIDIKDTGVGIPPRELKKIFDRFYRAETAAKGDVKGTGLGLAIAKDIVSAHGGEISAESSPQEGTRFTIKLPKDLRSENR